MKLEAYFYLILLLSFQSVFGNWQDGIAEKQIKTIKDYFFLLPPEWLDCENPESFSTQQSRSSAIKIVDEKNGYIQFFNKAEIALFKDKKNNTDLIALQIGECGEGAHCQNINSVFVYNSTQRKWVEQKQLIPASANCVKIYDEKIDSGICPYWKLPRYGRQIEVKNEHTDKVIAIIEWTGQSFNTVVLGTQ